MSDRRRAPRFVFFAPADARARTVHDAVVERWEGDRVVVLTTHAAVTGDEFVLRFSTASGEAATRLARVMSTTSDATESVPRYRLMLSLTPTAIDGAVAVVPMP